MAEPPEFDGREPLTKELMNDLVAAARRQRRVTGCPPMEAHDLGDAGVVVRLGSTVAAADTGSGFWARLNVGESGATWSECMPGRDPVSGETTLVDRPGGRTGYLDPLCGLLQGLGNFRPHRELSYVAIRLSPPATSGQFTPSYVVNQGDPSQTGPFVCPGVAGNCTPAELQASLNTPQPGMWSVSGRAGSVYYCAFDPAHGSPRVTFITVTNNTTTSTITQAIEDAFAGGQGESALYNFLPGGQAVWVRPLTAADGTVKHLFSLPYTGLWARIKRGEAAAGRYSFIEQVQSTQSPSQPIFLDDPTGVDDFCHEVNGETLVPPDTIVWLIPGWRSGVGFCWTFSALSDWRLLVMPASLTSPTAYPDTTNCVISMPRLADVKASSPYARMTEVDGSDPPVQAGTYLGLRAGSTAEGWPLFLKVSTPPSGWSGTLSIAQGLDVYDVTVTNGRVTSVT